MQFSSLRFLELPGDFWPGVPCWSAGGTGALPCRPPSSPSLQGCWSLCVGGGSGLALQRENGVSVAVDLIKHFGFQLKDKGFADNATVLLQIGMLHSRSYTYLT